MKTTALVFGFLGLMAAAWCNPRPDDRGRGEARVIIYEDADFRGGSLVLYAGEQIPDLRQVRFSSGKRVNDRISSIRIEGAASIALYDDFNFDGQVMRTTTDVRNLAYRQMPDLRVAWNDRISSLMVMSERWTGHGARPGPPPRPSRTVDPMIKQAYRDVLGRAADPDGLDYYRGLVIEQGWTDRMVREHMRNSDEYRHEVVDRMIHRVYMEELGREPDPMGLENYRQMIIRQNWTEQRLREALRASPEYRNRRSPRKH